MNKLTLLILAAAVAIAAGVYYFFFMEPEPTAAPPELPGVSGTQEVAVPAPEIQPHPPVVLEPQTAGPEPEPEPLPALLESDPVIAGQIAELVGTPILDQLFTREALVQHIVATIDNLPGPKLARKLLPIRPAEGDFAVEGDTADLRISAENAARYDPYVAMVRNLDVGELVSAYQRYYPLLEEAYRELGYPNGDFNARVLEVIDHLLQTPDISGEIYLVKPEAFYLFEDPDLERLSAGQKALLRMGRENAQIIKSRLEEFRFAISM